MTGEGNGRPRKYRISISGAVAKRIKELGRRAGETGRLDQFTDALLTIYRRLRNDPFGFGKITRRLADSGIVLHVGGVPPITLRLAIHEEQRTVFIIAVFLHPA